MPGRSYQLKHLPEFVGHWTQGVAIAIGHQLLHDLFGHLPTGLPKHFQRDKLISVSIKNLKTDEIQRSNKKHL
jgi:hypothetical protein